MRFTHRVLSAVCITLALVACSGSKSRGDAGSPYGTGDAKLAVPNPAGILNPFLTDGKAVVDALKAIETKSGKSLSLMSISANANSLNVDALNPDKPGTLQRYQVSGNGTLFGPIPEKMLKPGGVQFTAAELSADAFDPHAVPFAQLADAERQAIAQSKLKGARVREWGMRSKDQGNHLFLFLEAGDADAVAVLDPQLHIIEIKHP